MKGILKVANVCTVQETNCVTKSKCQLLAACN